MHPIQLNHHINGIHKIQTQDLSTTPITLNHLSYHYSLPLHSH